MQSDNLRTFEQILSKKSFPICLILASEEGERQNGYEIALKSAKVPVIFSYENFSKDIFFQEVETVPFLSQHKTIIIKEIDRIDKNIVEAIAPSLLSPPKWCSFILTAASLPPQSKVLKFAEQHGILCHIGGEKPWEKENRLAEWIIHEAKKENVTFTPAAAKRFVQQVEGTHLKQELEKLITYVGDKRIIEISDIETITLFHSQETIWQFVDAVFEKNGEEALRVGRNLYEETGGLLALIAQLRSQITTARRVLFLFQNDGRESITKTFPYLKGSLLDKKLKLFQAYGQEALQEALIALFETELLAKNSSQDLEVLFEILLFKLTHDSLPAPQFARRS